LSAIQPPARPWNAHQTAQACDGEIHPYALKGIEFFNAGDYFMAHEELETAWRDERGPIRDVYRGILQVGLGYYHILRLNYPGAVKMFKRCRQWLDPFPPACRGIDLDQLRTDFLRAEEALLRLGPAHLAQFDPTLLKPIVFIPAKDEKSAHV
jgi:predicted metal-dependent hydrolase